AAAATGQPWRGWKGSGGWGGRGGGGGPYLTVYDTKTVDVVTGTVDSVESFAPFRGMSMGLQLILKTDDGTMAIHLGPVWYVERQDVKIEKGDTVEVKGSKVSFEGAPAVIAAEVKRGGDTLRLRDEGGVPYWAESAAAAVAPVSN
ncbi:MAG: hypothetical protein HQK97_00365, partial [Nitrospirae bacterium]|nr:hypothetical protein [Nitrospirota bacterium]